MKTKVESGMYWHCHHDILCEYVWDNQERADYIKKEKPMNEIKTRLKLFKKVRGKLPVEFVKAWKKYSKAWKKYSKAGEKYSKAGEKYSKAGEKCDEAWKKCDEAREKYVEAWEKYFEARDKLDEAWKKHEPEIKALHKKECGCKEWNGKEIVFEERK